MLLILANVTDFLPCTKVFDILFSLLYSMESQNKTMR